MLLSGAQAIVKCLENQGVDTAFGYPGGTILPLYDALYDSRRIKHVLTVHEQGAAHAADGYARASGKVGVCIATSGPGATNLVTGLAAAFMDSIPVVAITGQVPTTLIGRDAFQEIDITGITIPVTKHNFLVKEIEQLPETLNQAFAIARSGRPGPVLVDVPKDVQSGKYDFDELIWDNGRNADLKPRIPNILAQIKESAACINASQKPVILAGGGVISAGAGQKLKELADKADIPVASTLMGIGAYPSSEPRYLGMTGLHGHKAANNAIHTADVLIVIGSRFNDRITGDRKKYAIGKTIIHIDIDLAEIKKNVNSRLGLVGKMNDILTTLNSLIQPIERSEWRQIIEGWQREEPFFDSEGLSAPWIFEELNRLKVREEAIFVTDVGQHQMWAAQYLKVDSPRGFISSGGLGSMGFGLPAAMGAQIARPDKRVIHIAGDGGFKMTGSELYTVSWQELPLISIIVNNGGLGMIRQLQKVFYNKRSIAAQLDTPVDFTLFARAFGIKAYSADTREDFAAAFDAAWRQKAPALIVANISEDHMVSPMLALEGTLENYVDVLGN